MIVPQWLRPGDKIALISPSFKLADEKLAKAREVICGWGFELVESGIITPEPYRRCYAGTISQRAKDMIWALKDPSIKALMCSRGGYGTIHLLDEIPAEIYRDNPKWLIGYSDITSLHSASSLAGVMSIHGAMGSTMSHDDGNDVSCQTMKNLIMGTVPSYKVKAHPLNHMGKVTARLIGGNMCTLYPLIDTKYDPTVGDDIILFIEEVEETYHNIDRITNFFKLHGLLDRVKGIIVGEFTDCPADLEYESVEQMLDEYFSPLGIPVCYGFPAGHDDAINLPLIEGAQTTLEVAPDGVRVAFDVPALEMVTINC